MKNLIFLACALCAVQAVPVPAEQPNELEILQIPLQGNKELDIVSLADDDGKINDRNKRTIGILRELFPELSKIVEQKIQMLIPIVLRTVGPIFLRSGLGGLGGAGTNNSPSFDDDDEDDDDDDKETKDDNSISGANGRKVSISLPTFPPDDDEDEDNDDEDVEVVNDNKSDASNDIKQSPSIGDQGTSSTTSTPSVVSTSTLEPLYQNIDLSVFDAEPSNSSTNQELASLNVEVPNDSIAVADVRQNDSAYLGSAPYVYELPPHLPNCDNDTKNDEFNSVR
ncbi:nucleolin isoform X3 [Bradysia coprophila]|uniref:nucleolin isoform X3 n=1 Tax=Bradysia coprophila TaxID=38358 RepID=UPI00187DC596|nr:nucleolin isoform X3 [Bradysia coprophila]